MSDFLPIFDYYNPSMPMVSDYGARESMAVPTVTLGRFRVTPGNYELVTSSNSQGIPLPLLVKCIILNIPLGLLLSILLMEQNSIYIYSAVFSNILSQT